MPFTQEEKQIVEWGKNNGKTGTEIQGEIFKYRATGKTASERNPVEKRGVVSRTIKDIPSDIKETFTGAVDSVSEGFKTADDVAGRVVSGETSPSAGTFQTIGAGLRAGASVVGQGVIGLGKLFTTPEAEESIKGKVEKGVEKVIEFGPVADVYGAYENLSPEAKRNVDAGFGVVEGITTAFGFAPVVNKFKNVLTGTASKLLRESDSILTKIKEVNIPKTDIGISVNSLKGKVKGFRAEISDIDPQVETVLRRSTFDDVNKHFVDARNAISNPEKYTPFEITGNKASSAYDAIDEARKKAIQGKKSILAQAPDARVSGNTINDVMSTGIARFDEQFGATVKPNGIITQTGGRTLKLDVSDQKLVSEYFNRLNSLGLSPTVQQVDDFVDWAQSQLYKQSKTVSKFEVASDPVIKQLQGITGDLNTRLKDTVGNGYGEVNARISKLIELQDELSRSLGADARKGAGLVKRLFSPAGGDTKRIFELIRQETGIDLFKEATLAKFAMENVGDPRATSLLKQLDVAVKESSELEITKPLSIVKFIRERADLDGQELANELIRKFNVE